MINLILFCMGTASLTHFFWVTMNEGMIFHKWHLFIEKVGEKRLWLYKVLGGCTYCYGTWIFICTYSITAVFILSGNFLSLAINGVLGIGFNYVFIKAIEKL